MMAYELPTLPPSLPAPNLSLVGFRERAFRYPAHTVHRTLAASRYPTEAQHSTYTLLASACAGGT